MPPPHPDPLDVRPVTLEGEHARLEPLALTHVDGLAAAGRDPEIFRWMPWTPYTRADFERLVRDALDAQAAGSALPWAIIERASGAIVGSTRLLAISPADRRVEVGWTWLARRVQRTPINTECKFLILRHCFETLGCVRVELKTDFRNEQSRRAIARIGAKEEGIFRRHMRVQHGVMRDTVWFSILDDEWPGVRARLAAMLRR